MEVSRQIGSAAGDRRQAGMRSNRFGSLSVLIMAMHHGQCIMGNELWRCQRTASRVTRFISASSQADQSP